MQADSPPLFTPTPSHLLTPALSHAQHAPADWCISQVWLSYAGFEAAPLPAPASEEGDAEQEAAQAAQEDAEDEEVRENGHGPLFALVSGKCLAAEIFSEPYTLQVF